MSEHVLTVGFQHSLLSCRNNSCMEKLIHIPQLSLSPQRQEDTSFLTARWLGFSFITMIHWQTLTKGLQSQGTVALKSYLKKFLYIRALIWKAPYDMTDWLGNKENNLWHSLWSTLWNKAPGTEISLDLFFFFSFVFLWKASFILHGCLKYSFISV